jgi:hypothetical protein
VSEEAAYTNHVLALLPVAEPAANRDPRA